MDDQRQDEQPEDEAAATRDRGDLNVSPASPADLQDELPDFQPGEGPGPTPGQ